MSTIRKTFWALVALAFSSTVAFAQSIEVTGPAGGEKWQVGTLQTIRWVAKDVAGPAEVRMDYPGKSIRLANVELSRGSYRFKVPDDWPQREDWNAVVTAYGGNNGEDVWGVSGRLAISGPPEVAAKAEEPATLGPRRSGDVYWGVSGDWEIVWNEDEAMCFAGRWFGDRLGVRIGLNSRRADPRLSLGLAYPTEGSFQFGPERSLKFDFGGSVLTGRISSLELGGKVALLSIGTTQSDQIGSVLETFSRAANVRVTLIESGEKAHTYPPFSLTGSRKAVSRMRGCVAAPDHAQAPSDAGEPMPQRDEANALFDRAMAAMDTGEHGKAEALIREVIALEREISGEESEPVLDLQIQLAKSLSAQEKFAEAEDVLASVIPRYEARPDADASFVLSILMYYAQTLDGQGRLGEAEMHYRDALVAAADLPKGEDRINENILQGLARNLYDQGRLAESEATYDQLVARLESRPNPSPDALSMVLAERQFVRAERAKAKASTEADGPAQDTLSSPGSVVIAELEKELGRPLPVLVLAVLDREAAGEPSITGREETPPQEERYRTWSEVGGWEIKWDEELAACIASQYRDDGYGIGFGLGIDQRDGEGDVAWIMAAKPRPSGDFQFNKEVEFDVKWDTGAALNNARYMYAWSDSRRVWYYLPVHDARHVQDMITQFARANSVSVLEHYAPNGFREDLGRYSMAGTSMASHELEPCLAAQGRHPEAEIIDDLGIGIPVAGPAPLFDPVHAGPAMVQAVTEDLVTLGFYDARPGEPWSDAGDAAMRAAFEFFGLQGSFEEDNQKVIKGAAIMVRENGLPLKVAKVLALALPAGNRAFSEAASTYLAKDFYEAEEILRPAVDLFVTGMGARNDQTVQVVDLYSFVLRDLDRIDEANVCREASGLEPFFGGPISIGGQENETCVDW